MASVNDTQAEYVAMVFPDHPRKHMDKHLRPYKCPVPNCMVNNFATSGDLKRHHREVHGNPSFVCPNTSCKRHRKGFSRRDNLVQHMKRTHNQDEQDVDAMHASRLTEAVIRSSYEVTNETAAVGEQVGVLGVSVASVATLTSDLDVSSLKKTHLTAKLRELEIERVKAQKAMAQFDGDIAALKRVLSIM
ncbi:hypothetical protein EG329_010828 [Mollisiaceae sp. DMI_Dod_QoI]|nr:hypothetical protein EG329_010828 [Helotiales sp. DMI_Dod_QoI]